MTAIFDMGSAIVQQLNVVCRPLQGWKLAPAHQPMAGYFYVGPVEILSGLVKFTITSIEMMGFVSCTDDREKVSFAKDLK